MKKYNQPEPVNWNRCTCSKFYEGGIQSAVKTRQDVNPTPIVTKVDPNCPERHKPGHP